MSKDYIENRVKEFFTNIGWWIYWKTKWQKNLEWKEKLSPKTILGKQIRDNLAYFILYGLDEERNHKVNQTTNDLLNEIRKLNGIEIPNNDEFPRGKERYCPRCYFEDDKEVLRVDCDGHKNDSKQFNKDFAVNDPTSKL